MPAQQIVEWIVPLAGHHFDLEDLPLYLDESPVSVVCRDGQYFLSMSVELIGEGYEDVMSAAEEYLAILNGLTATTLSGVRTIALADGAYFGINHAGNVVSTVIAASSSEIRSKAGHVTLVVGGNQLPDSRKGVLTPLLRRARSNLAMTNALRIVGRAKPTWPELYLAFEIVQSAVGGQMYENGWITRSDAKRFSQTANSYAVLGIEGRHAERKWQPPVTPMTHAEAIRKIRTLVAGWIKSGVEVNA